MRPPVLVAATLALGLALAGPLTAQDVNVGGGQDVNEPVAPGLTEIPVEGQIAPEDIPLFVPIEDQITGRVTIPDDKLGTLVQPEGRQWRAFRIQGVFWTATVAILLTVVALAAFFLWKGTIRIGSGRSGRWVPRFGGFERFVHWATALSFLTLAISGLIITFGRYLLIPLIGHFAYTPLANVSKYLHNWSAFPFVLGILAMLVLWIRDNIPRKSDIEWFRRAGGVFNRKGTPHLETHRFNAGQKVIFWVVVLGGLAASITGYMMMTPFAWTGISGMQTAHVVHALIAIVMIVTIIVHIYIGTLGMEGSFDAMGRGEVDENWAAEHHRGWYEARFRRNRTGTAAGRVEPGQTTPAE